MKPLPLAALASLLLAASAPAQEQEKVIERSFMKLRSGDVDKMQDKTFGGASGFSAKTYDAAAYSGVKSAEIKKFETKSFFGIKNPWFGKTVFEAPTDRLSQKSDRAADDTFDTDAYATTGYDTREGESPR